MLDLPLPHQRASKAAGARTWSCGTDALRHRLVRRQACCLSAAAQQTAKELRSEPADLGVSSVATAWGHHEPASRKQAPGPAGHSIAVSSSQWHLLPPSPAVWPLALAPTAACRPAALRRRIGAAGRRSHPRPERGSGLALGPAPTAVAGGGGGCPRDAHPRPEHIRPASPSQPGPNMSAMRVPRQRGRLCRHHAVAALMAAALALLALPPAHGGWEQQGERRPCPVCRLQRGSRLLCMHALQARRRHSVLTRRRPGAALAPPCAPSPRRGCSHGAAERAAVS